MTGDWPAEMPFYHGAVIALWVLALVAAAAVGVLLNAMVLRKAGFSPWWALLFLVPVFYIVGLWAFAFARWPQERGEAEHVEGPAA